MKFLDKYELARFTWEHCASCSPANRASCVKCFQKLMYIENQINNDIPLNCYACGQLNFDQKVQCTLKIFDKYDNLYKKYYNTYHKDCPFRKETINDN